MNTKLLLVDDDIEDLENLTGIILEISPTIKISVAQNGNEMIRLLESEAQLPDFIFLDLNMPIKTGFECLTEIRSNEKWKAIKIVILTTSSHREQINEVYKMGADLYIRKPNSYNAFKEILSKCLQMDWGFEKSVNAFENKDNSINFFDSRLVYNDIVENIALGIVVVNFFQDGSFFISYTNKEFHKIAPTYSNKIHNENSNHLFDSAHPDDLPLIQASVKQLFELKEFDIEFRIIDAGKTKNIRSQGKPIFNKSGNCITAYIYFNDITEQVKNQESLKESEKKYKYMFENAPHPMIVWEIGTLNISDVNKKATELYGYTKEEFTQLNSREISHPEDIPLIERITRNLESYGSEHQKVWRHLKKNGELMYVDVSANVFELNGKLVSIAHIQNVTEKIKADEEIKLMDFAFKKSATPIMLLLATGEFYSFNDALLKLLGYTKEELSKMNLLNVATTMDEASCIKQWNEIREKKNIVFDCHFERKDGTLLDVEISSNLINYNENEVNFCYINDITEKKKAEEKLKLSDYIIQKSTTAIYLIKSDGSIYDFNEAAHNMLGYTKEEFAMLDQMDIDPRLNSDIILEGFEVLRREGKVHFQATIVKKDGALIDVDIISTFIVYNGLELKCLFLTDVTEQNKVSAEIYSINELLQRQTNRLLLATKSAQLGIWDWNLKNNELTWDEGMYRLYNIAENEFNSVYEGWFSRLHPQDIQRLNNDLELAITNKKEYKPEFRIVWNDSSVHYINSSAIIERDNDGNAIRMIGTNWDVTAEKERIQHLKLLESVIVHTKDSILITEAEPFDLPGPRIIFVNPAFEKMTGYTPEEVIGLSPRILQNEDTDRKELDKLRTAMNNWEPCEITISNSRKNGEKFWNNFSIAPIANEKGWYTHWIAVERDVTKEIEAALEKERMIKELMDINLELKQFSYITTHNLRAPLTNLVLICKLLSPEKIEDPSTLKLIEFLKTSTNQLNETLNDLINVLIVKDNTDLLLDELSFEEILD
ncbi:PAS domain S-box protein [Flavobacterium sp. K77]|uniref:PAS domain S-box protein n=1 Tax=Flavobacterium sp. K77 TaxID=2910676 RepID=UPI001F335ED1|nr:PAS domain S-box protein [Flavobacterium sp. K77]MCF6141323.1 PAS domain S-box protein [Flavobacterium sp. K77]